MLKRMSSRRAAAVKVCQGGDDEHEGTAMAGCDCGYGCPDCQCKGCQQVNRSQDSINMFNPCTHCPITPNSSDSTEHHVTPSTNSSCKLKMCPEHLEAASANAKAQSQQSTQQQPVAIEEPDGSFSIVEWIQQNLPCVSQAANQVQLDISQDIQMKQTASCTSNNHNNNHQTTDCCESNKVQLHQQLQHQHSQDQQQQQQEQDLQCPISIDELITPSKQSSLESSSWCDLSTITPCPVTIDDTHIAGGGHCIPQQQQQQQAPNRQIQTATEATIENKRNSLFASNRQASSWLSGHLGLIPAPPHTSQQQHQNLQQPAPLSKPPSLIKSASLTKPPSFTKASSFDHATIANRKDASKPPISKSKSIPPVIPLKRTTSQTIALQLKRCPSSRSTSRSNTPIDLAEATGCGTIQCLSNNHCGDAAFIDASSSGDAGLNSTQGSSHNNANQDKKLQCIDNPNTCAGVEPLVFSCGDTNLDESLLYQSNSVDVDVNRTHSKLTVASQGTMDTGTGTMGTHHTNTLHTILTKGNYTNSAVATSTQQQYVNVVDNIDYITPKITNKCIDADTTSILDSSISSSLPSQYPLSRQNSRGYEKSSRKMKNKQLLRRSPSPMTMVGGKSVVQLEKFLKLSSNKSSHNNSECGTITTDGASGLDSALTGNSSKRKVQWGSTKNLPVSIAANDYSTEVAPSGNGKGAKSRSAVPVPSQSEIKPFALYHEEIVTALIDSALKGNESQGADALRNENTLSEPPAPETMPHSPKRVASFTPMRKMRRNSPHRASLSTPIWKRNRSSTKLDQIGKVKSDRKIGEGNDYPIERSVSLFSFKSKQSPPPLPVPAPAISLEKKPLDYIHSQCQLLKEKGSDKKKSQPDGKNASAVGKEAVLEKLHEKLSMLGDIESGKYGKAAEMLQSNAVAFSIHGGSDSADQNKQRRHVRNGSSGNSASINRSDSHTVGGSSDVVLPAGSFEKRKAMVETRSLLTLRMGFVSMSYGILLQWDYESRLVELIVLRKMCRDDFLEGNIEDTSESTTTVTSKSSKPSTASAASTATLESNTSRSPEADAYTGLSLFPQLLSEPDQRPKSFLSVSVVNIKHIHTGCEKCLDPIIANEHIGAKSKEKRHVIRPYIRFVLGKNEHCTKPAKLLLNGHLYYYKRHNNSCQLPMPKEEFRWFAGQEDLLVEVRDMQSCLAKNSGGGKGLLGGKNSTKSSSRSQTSSPNDPIIAVVTVPLSSVNIEDDDDKVLPSDGDESVLTPWKHLKTKKNEYSRDDTSSTNINLPLRMIGCSTPSFGSISLQITVKVPRQSSDPNQSTSELNSATGESIEIGAIARMMQGWSIYDNAGENDENQVVSSKLSRRKMRKSVPRWDKKWNPKTKKWSKLRLTGSSSRDITSEQANWFTFLKWGDEK